MKGQTWKNHLSDIEQRKSYETLSGKQHRGEEAMTDGKNGEDQTEAMGGSSSTDTSFASCETIVISADENKKDDKDKLPIPSSPEG